MSVLAIRGISDVRRNAGRFVTVWSVLLLLLLAVGLLDPGRVASIVELALGSFLSTLPYIAFAVMTIAYLKACGAETVVSSAFAGRETRMILLAALLGGLAPFCSCEVIPFIAGLLAVGVPLSAVMAFWLSSPLIDPPTVFITAGALGWEFAIGKAAAAVALGLFGGFGVRWLVNRGAFEAPLRPREGCGSCCGSAPFDGAPNWRFWTESERQRTFVSEFRSNAIFLVKWLLLAYLLEALLITYIPAEVIGGVVGGEGLGPVVIGALVGAPAYLNGYAAPPLVAGFMAQGMTAGAAMAFMVAGAVSSVPAMAAVWSLVRPRVFLAYMTFGIVGAAAVGVVFDRLV